MRKLLLISFFLFPFMAAAANTIKYPDRAEKLRIDGEVNVLYDVNAKGRAQNIRIVSAQPDYVFNRSIRAQIAQWKYPQGSPQSDIPLRVIFKAN